jgi:hypothetical protein
MVLGIQAGTGFVDSFANQLNTKLPPALHEQAVYAQTTANLKQCIPGVAGTCPQYYTCDPNLNKCVGIGNVQCDPTLMNSVSCSDSNGQPDDTICLANGVSGPCDVTAMKCHDASPCTLSDAADQLVEGISVGEQLLGLTDPNQALQALVKDPMGTTTPTAQTNWVCVPNNGASDFDPCDNAVGTCGFVLRAKRLNVSSDAVELVWFDRAPDPGRASSADTAFAAFVAEVGAGGTSYESLCQANSQSAPDPVVPAFWAASHQGESGECPTISSGGAAPICRPEDGPGSMCACGVPTNPDTGLCEFCGQDSDCNPRSPTSVGGTCDLVTHRCWSNTICQYAGEPCFYPYEYCDVTYGFCVPEMACPVPPTN